MGPEVLVTWQEFRSLETCPKQYLFQAQGLAGAPARGGLGTTVLGSRRSQRRELLAAVAAQIVRTFYLGSMWGQEPQACADMGAAEMRAELSRARAGLWHLDSWDLGQLEGPGLEDARQAAAGLQATCGRWVLAGPRIEPHRVVAAPLEPGSQVVLVSRPHLYLLREDGEQWLVAPSFRRESWDAKRGRFLFPDEEQDALEWDVLVSYLATAKLPDRAAVLPLRYPAGYRWGAELDRERNRLTKNLRSRAREDCRVAAGWLAGRPESEGLLWRRPSLGGLGALAARVAAGACRLGETSYPARLGSWCARCPFESQCSDRVSVVQARRRVRRAMGPQDLARGTVVRLGE